MVDYKPELVTALNTIGIPVYYELFVQSGTATPCITYMETNDSVTEWADHLVWATKSYRIKIWGGDLNTLHTYQASVDRKMFDLGFKRTNYNELWYNNNVCMILDYQCLIQEFIN